MGDVLSCLFLLMAFAYLESAITVYRIHRHERLNRHAAALLLWIGLYASVCALFFVARTPAEARILTKVAVDWAIMTVPIATLFFLILSRDLRPSRLPAFVALLFAVPAVLVCVSIRAPLVQTDVALTRFGWNMLSADRLSFWDAVYYLYGAVCMLGGIAAAAHRAIRTRDRIEKAQIASLLGCTLIALFIVLASFSTVGRGVRRNVDTGMLFDWLPQWVLLVGFLIGLRFTMWRHRLLILLPEVRATELLSASDTAFMLIDSRNRVTYTNRMATELFALPSSSNRSIVGTPLAELVRPRYVADAQLSRLARGPASPKRFVLLMGETAGQQGETRPHGAGPQLPIELALFPMFSDGGNYLGSLVTAKIASEVQRSWREFGLTEREIEILILLGEGMSTGEVARWLNISALTAKRHIHNSYDKIGARNRIELVRALKGG